MNRFLALLLLLSTTLAVQAGDVKIGKAKSVQCIACHGEAGVSNNDQWPNLAGQKKGYLVTQLKAYRDGKRIDIMMTPMTKTLKNDDIEHLATYYSSLK